MTTDERTEEHAAVKSQMMTLRRDTIEEVFRYLDLLLPPHVGFTVAKHSLLAKEELPPQMTRAEKEAIVLATAYFLRKGGVTDSEWESIPKAVLDERPEEMAAMVRAVTYGR